MADYIHLNPVRAGMVKDPGEYRWSSDGEAMGATGRVKGDSLTRSGAKAKGCSGACAAELRAECGAE
jgi:hypothetical protein